MKATVPVRQLLPESPGLGWYPRLPAALWRNAHAAAYPAVAVLDTHDVPGPTVDPCLNLGESVLMERKAEQVSWT